MSSEWGPQLGVGKRAGLELRGVLWSFAVIENKVLLLSGQGGRTDAHCAL